MKIRSMRPKHNVIDIAEWNGLEELNHSELIVYIRLVSATSVFGNKVRIINAKLYKDGRTCTRALQGLAEHGLIRLHYDRDDSRRTIEVL